MSAAVSNKSGHDGGEGEGGYIILLLHVLLAFLTVAFFTFQAIKPRRLPRDVPTLDSSQHYHRLLGHLPYARKLVNRWPTEAMKWNKHHFKYRTWGMTFPNLPHLPPYLFYINDEVNVKHVLDDNFKNYVKGAIIRSWMHDLLGDGIFAVDGSKWKVHRKSMSHMFSRNLLRYSAGIMRQKLDVILKDLEDAIDGHEHDEDAMVVLDFQDLMLRLLFDATSIFAFGVDLNTLSKNNAKEQEHSFFAAFDKISYHIYRRGTDALYPLKRALGIGSEKLIAESMRTINDFAMNIIAEKRKHAVNMGEMGDNVDKFDLLSKYIEYSRKENDYISDQDLRDIVVNVMFAGRDTTSYALSWAFYELGRNPHVKQKVMREVERVCGVGDDAEYSFDNMNKLQYTHHVILEVLRLHPPIPENVRYAVKSDTLPDGTQVPQGAAILMSYYSMSRNEETWGRGAEDFNPSRFESSSLDSKEETNSNKNKEPSPFMFPVFHAGPRFCLGKPMAMMNMKLVLSILLTSGFEFKDKAEHSGDYHYSFTLSMKDSFPVEISRRHC